MDDVLQIADEVDEIGFPVSPPGIGTAASRKRQVGDINLSVSCGGVIVERGDLIVADETEIVVVPASYLADVWDAVSRLHPDVCGPDVVGIEKRQWRVTSRVTPVRETNVDDRCDCRTRLPPRESCKVLVAPRLCRLSLSERLPTWLMLRFSLGYKRPMRSLYVQGGGD